jgi:hypothetical protein
MKKLLLWIEIGGEQSYTILDKRNISHLQGSCWFQHPTTGRLIDAMTTVFVRDHSKSSDLILERWI